MTFIDGAKITKRDNGAGWRDCAITGQTDESSATARTRSVRDWGRAEQIADCGTVEVEATLTG